MRLSLKELIEKLNRYDAVFENPEIVVRIPGVKIDIETDGEDIYHKISKPSIVEICELTSERIHGTLQLQLVTETLVFNDDADDE